MRRKMRIKPSQSCAEDSESSQKKAVSVSRFDFYLKKNISQAQNFQAPRSTRRKSKAHERESRQQAKW